MLTWKLCVYERGSDLGCKTKIALPSFVKANREVSLHSSNFKLSFLSHGNPELVFLINTALMMRG